MVKVLKQQYLADVVSSDKEKQTIFKENHDSALGGHPGETKTINKISVRYYWPGITNDIKKWVIMIIILLILIL